MTLTELWERGLLTYDEVYDELSATSGTMLFNAHIAAQKREHMAQLAEGVAREARDMAQARTRLQCRMFQVYANKKLEEIVEWLENQEEVDVEKGIEKVKEGVKLIKASRERLKKVENEFDEVKKELEKEIE